MNKVKNKQTSETGGAGIKVLLVLVMFGLVGHAGLNYIPVAYQAESFKQELNTAVIQGTSIPSVKTKPVESVENKVKMAMKSSGLPSDATLSVKESNKVIYTRVTYAIEVPLLPFGLYNYIYAFDQTVTPTGFLSKQ